MAIALTRLSANEYDNLMSGRMTPVMAAEYLREGRITLRSFDQTLREMYPGADLQHRLVETFATEEESWESVRRKVGNWLLGRNMPTRREDVYRIAFALNLSEVQCNLLLGICSGYGIHYRNGRDVIYAWFLRRRGSYEQASGFYQSLPEMPHYTDLPISDASHLTNEIQNVFNLAMDQAALRRCYWENLENFGRLHLRAYRYFRRYLDELIHPAPAWGQDAEPDYSMEAVMNSYLSLSVPSTRNRSQFSLIQKMIKANWPNTTSLKNIYHHREDVPRKVLLLLYVVTENILDGNGPDPWFGEYASPQERLEDHWWAMNAMLTDCGMPTMDPRNATDWLVLYAVTAEENSMSERMEQVISEIFA